MFMLHVLRQQYTTINPIVLRLCCMQPAADVALVPPAYSTKDLKDR
jgi:hypothetical protein